MDGDSYGNPEVSMTTCLATVPAGFTDNDQDCDDNNASKYTGAPCSTGSGCTTALDGCCMCATTDEDEDGICDGIDICPYEDDKVDANDDGVPDCIQNCTGSDHFDVAFIRTNSDSAVTSSTKQFAEAVRAVQFTVYNLGRKKDSYEEKVSIWYTKGSEEIFAGDMTYE
jgi:hypothetical protein